MSRNNQKPLVLVQLCSWAVLAVMVCVGWLLFGLHTGKSLLIGGLLANISFWLLKRDLIGLLQGELTAVKSRFFIKYYARLAVVAILLFLMIRFGAVNVVALLIGLSTVFVSIAFVAVVGVRKELNIKEAS